MQLAWAVKVLVYVKQGSIVNLHQTWQESAVTAMPSPSVSFLLSSYWLLTLPPKIFPEAPGVLTAYNPGGKGRGPFVCFSQSSWNRLTGFPRTSHWSGVLMDALMDQLWVRRPSLNEQGYQEMGERAPQSKKCFTNIPLQKGHEVHLERAFLTFLIFRLVPGGGSFSGALQLVGGRAWVKLGPGQ